MTRVLFCCSNVWHGTLDLYAAKTKDEKPWTSAQKARCKAYRSWYARRNQKPKPKAKSKRQRNVLNRPS